jgi:hypothetical protein
MRQPGDHTGNRRHARSPTSSLKSWKHPGRNREGAVPSGYKAAPCGRGACCRRVVEACDPQ